MSQILIRNIDPADYEQFVKKADSLGLKMEPYARQVIKDALKNPRKEQAEIVIKVGQALVSVVAEALGRTQGANQESREKLTKTLLRIFEQEVGSEH